MTDMRATERLLEVIEELSTNALDPKIGDISEDMRSHGRLQEVILAVRELRRRGDTLVRAADLRVVVEALSQIPRDDCYIPNFGEVDRALDRIENALGGKPL